MKEYQRIGLERVEKLMQLCKRFPDKAKRYVYLARRISEKINLPIPKKYKRWICKNCNAFLVPGENCTVRLKNKRKIVTCTLCGEKKRYEYAV